MPEDLDSSPKAKSEASFGYGRVPEDAKQGLVNEVFAKVARRYDLMNDLMSGGLHRLWKSELLTWLGPPKSAVPYALLDVAGGTGDVAYRFLEEAGKGASAVICDISAEMIEVGRERVPEGEDRARFVHANAEALPFAREASMPIRSPSAFATSRISMRLLPRRSACSSPAGDFSASNSRASRFRCSTSFTTPIPSMRSRRSAPLSRATAPLIAILWRASDASPIRKRSCA